MLTLKINAIYLTSPVVFFWYDWFNLEWVIQFMFNRNFFLSNIKCCFSHLSNKRAKSQKVEREINVQVGMELSKSAIIWLSKSIFYVKNHQNLFQFYIPLNIKLEQCAVVLSKAGRRQEPILFLRPIKRFLMFALLFPNYGVIKHKGTKRWGPFARS